MTNTEVDKLIKKVARGDIEALKILYENLSKPVYFYALHLCKNPEVAEDVMQDTFISIMRNSEKYISKEKASAWIFTIVKNKVADYQRKQKNTVQIEEIENTACLSNPIDYLIDENSALEILRILNEKERNVVTMRVLVGFSLTQAAKELNMPKGSAFWTYNNAMKKLKKALKGEENYVRKDKESNKETG